MFDKNLHIKELHLSEKEIETNFPIFLFDTVSLKKITSYSTSEAFIVEKNGSLLECQFTDKKSYERTKSKVQEFKKRNYTNFNEKFDYKIYNEYVQRGFIIAFNDKSKIMLLIDVNSCLYNKQKQRVLKLLKENITTDLYVLNCGGKQLITKN